MLVSDFHYNLPEDLIAQEPLADRSASRMLVLDRAAGTWEHRRFSDLPEYLAPADCVVLNDTRVLPARLVTRRETGGRAELLLLRPLGEDVWEALVKPARRLRPGTVLRFGERLQATVVGPAVDGVAPVRLEYAGELLAVLEEVGLTPLPPYIHRAHQEEAVERERADHLRYQTVYAQEPGAAAAPTAGLHFTEEVLARIAARGTAVTRLTLHVGLGTFRPVAVERVEEHRMHAEFYRVGEEAARTVNERRAAGGRCVAIGTTVARTLETVADETGQVPAGEGWSEIFIYPGYRFRVVDRLLTNFHLPHSTLLMLVSALAGRELILEAYRAAVAERYRFFSYGDCMLIL
ncbi:MAG TPA: tRNA preQ1(34) S-adenosylmethionine ribosyltransferase-isomerase QueA [Armatimonadota bacterium]|jgi:S-adenosylmethionine:tRNA ribosyltransferase-isomerase